VPDAIAREQRARVTTWNVPAMSDDDNRIGSPGRGAPAHLVDAFRHRREHRRLEGRIPGDKRLKVEGIQSHQARVALGPEIGNRVGTQEHRRFAKEFTALARCKFRLAGTDTLRNRHRTVEQHVEVRFFTFAHEILTGEHVYVGRLGCNFGEFGIGKRGEEGQVAQHVRIDHDVMSRQSIRTFGCDFSAARSIRPGVYARKHVARWSSRMPAACRNA